MSGCAGPAWPACPGGRADLGNGLLIRVTQVRILPGAPHRGPAAPIGPSRRGYRWPSMDDPDDRWPQAVKHRFRPLRDRLVRVMGGTLPERGLSYEELVHLLYPSLPDELR